MYSFLLQWKCTQFKVPTSNAALRNAQHLAGALAQKRVLRAVLELLMVAYFAYVCRTE